MSELEPEATHSGLNLNDVLFMLFRHKWKILLCTAIGFLACCGRLFSSSSRLRVRGQAVCAICGRQERR